MRGNLKKFLQTKSLAITSLVFGILAIVFSRSLIGLASALVAIALGLIALHSMKQSGDLKGRTKARWGLGLGISSVLILLVMFAVEVRTQRAVDGLRKSNPELFNAYLEKPAVTTPVQRRPAPQKGASLDEMLEELVRSLQEPDTPEKKVLFSRNVAAQSFCDKGDVEAKKENWSAAITYYQKATEEDPEMGAAWFFVGFCCDKLGRYEEAIEACKQAIRIEPDFAAAHFTLGRAYYGLGRHQEAMEAYKQAIRIEPDFAQAHYSLGGVYIMLNRMQEAMEACKQAIRIEPDWAAAHYSLGGIYLIIDDKGSALEEYKILKTLDAEQANELFNLIYK